MVCHVKGPVHDRKKNAVGRLFGKNTAGGRIATARHWKLIIKKRGLSWGTGFKSGYNDTDLLFPSTSLSPVHSLGGLVL